MTKPLWMQVREAFERKNYYPPSSELRDELVGIATDYADQKLAAAHAEIERLKQGAIGLATMLNEVADAQIRAAEAERDEARAQVAAAFEAAEKALESRKYGDPDEREEYAFDAALDRGIVAIRALTPDHAKSALEAYGREKVREGMRMAVDKIMDRINNTDFAMNYHAPLTSFCKSILTTMEKEGEE